MFVSSVVFGFNGKRQSLNGPQVQVRHLLDVAFLVLQFAQVQTIRAINQVDGRHQQQRGFPVESLVEPGHRPGDSRAHQVVGERPEVAVHQNADQRPALGQRDDCRDGARVRDEVNGRRESQQDRAIANQQVRQLAMVIIDIGQRRRNRARATLNVTCIASGRSGYRHCASIETAPRISVSLKLSSRTPIRMNRKFTDSVPVIPGRFTFSRDARIAIPK